MIDARKNLIVLILILTATLVSLVWLNFSKIEKDQSAQTLVKRYVPQNSLSIKLSRGKVDYFTVSSRSRIVFYEKLDSIIYESDLDGTNKKALTKIPNASEIVFSPDGRKVITLISGRKYFFDLTGNQRVELDRKIQTVVFSPNSEKIAFYLPDGNGVFVSNPDGSNPSAILKTRFESLKLLWPSDLIIFNSEEDNFSFKAFSITPEGKDFKKISPEEFNPHAQNAQSEDEYSIFVNPDDGRLYSLRLK